MEKKLASNNGKEGFMPVEEMPYNEPMMKVWPAVSFLEGFGKNVHLQTDKDGHPIIINQIGMSDPTNITEGILTEEQATAFMTHMAACRMLHLSKLSEERQEVVRCFCIQDLNGLGMKHLTSQTRYFIKLFIRIMSENFPEVMAKIRVINAPWAFTVAWAMIKPILHPRIIKKIKILGKNYQNELYEDISRDQLPKSYGGNLDFLMPALVPEGNDVNEITISRGSMETISFPIDDITKSHLSFQFQCTSGDITIVFEFLPYVLNDKKTFDDAYAEAAACKFEVKCIERRDGGVVKLNVPITEDGENTKGGVRSGYVMIKFDNSFSWIKSKTIKYNINVLDA